MPISGFERSICSIRWLHNSTLRCAPHWLGSLFARPCWPTPLLLLRRMPPRAPAFATPHRPSSPIRRFPKLARSIPPTRAVNVFRATARHSFPVSVPTMLRTPWRHVAPILPSNAPRMLPWSTPSPPWAGATRWFPDLGSPDPWPCSSAPRALMLAFPPLRQHMSTGLRASTTSGRRRVWPLLMLAVLHVPPTRTIQATAMKPMPANRKLCCRLASIVFVVLRADFVLWQVPSWISLGSWRARLRMRCSVPCP